MSWTLNIVLLLHEVNNISTFPRPQAQAFYEREVEAMKRAQQLSADNLLAWKHTEADLRREFQTQEAALQKTLGKLRAELARVTEEARENRERSYKLQGSLAAAEHNNKVKGGWDLNSPSKPPCPAFVARRLGVLKIMTRIITYLFMSRSIVFNSRV